MQPNKLAKKFWLLLLRNAEGEGGGGAAAGEGATAAAATGEGAGEAPASTTEPSLGTTLLGEDTAAGATTEPPAAETAPEVFALDKLTLPEGFELAEEVGTSLADIINDPKLAPQERAQKLVELHASSLEAQVKATQEANVNVWKEMNDKWRAETLALPEFAANPDAAIGSVKQALLAAGAKPELFQALDLTGAGNNPHILQMLYKLTRPFVEGGVVGASSKKVTPASRAAVMYPTMTAKE